MCSVIVAWKHNCRECTTASFEVQWVNSKNPEIDSYLYNTIFYCQMKQKISYRMVLGFTTTYAVSAYDH